MIFDWPRRFGTQLLNFGVSSSDLLITETPVSKNFDAIWALLEANTVFTKIVPIGNRIKFNSNESKPFKDNVTSADMPEIMVYMPNIKVNLMSSSSSARINYTFEIAMNTGDYRINYMMNKLQWLVMCIMHNGQSALSQVEWCGKKINKLITINDIQIGDNHGEHRERGVKGFATLWSCEIESHISHGDFVLTES